MPRYFTIPKRPRAYWDDGEWVYSESGQAHSCTVYEPEEHNIPTGILNCEGEPLFRRVRQPIGFLAEHED